MCNLELATGDVEEDKDLKNGWPLEFMPKPRSLSTGSMASTVEYQDTPTDISLDMPIDKFTESGLPWAFPPVGFENSPKPEPGALLEVPS
eukprot:1634548-Lingulodinium_polyedra.AAC.1